MNTYIESVKKYIPPNNTGYRYIKHITVYVPIKELGIEMLERRRQPIPFLYETILKLLKFGITDITQTASILGLEMDVYTEIISQMAFEDFIFVSDSNIGLTNKGVQALTDLKKVTIKRSYLNNIYVNMITGEIYEGEPHGLCKTPKPSCMCLDQTITVNIDFFRKHIEQITKIFQSNTIDEMFFESGTIDREIYRLLDIDYENTWFSKLSCFVFLTPDNSEILLSFEDDNDSQYLSAAMIQIRNHSTGALKIFDYYKREYSGFPEIDQIKLAARDELIIILGQREKEKISTEEIENKYYTNRYLLSGEVEEIVCTCNSFKPKTVLVASPKMREFLESPDIGAAITSLSITKLILIYNNDEYNVQHSINWLKQSSKRKNLEIECLPQSSDSRVVNGKIIVDPCFSISIYYRQIPINYETNGFLEEELADITFETSAVSNELNNYKKCYKC